MATINTVFVIIIDFFQEAVVKNITMVKNTGSGSSTAINDYVSLGKLFNIPVLQVFYMYI